MILDFYTLKGFLGITNDDQDGNLKLIHQRAESAIQSMFDREFESASYFWALDGTGTCNLRLPQYPIISLSYLGTKTEGIKIKNTSLDASNAYVTVDDTNLTLVVSGGANASTTNLAKTTYTTLTTMIAAINAAGKGWAAEIYDSDFASYLTANLVSVKNFFAGSWNGVTATYKYLEILDEPFSGYEVYDEEGAGYIYHPHGFPKGRRNIMVKCTAGYAAADMPADLQGLISDMVSIAYQKTSQNMTGVKSFRIGEYSVTYGNGAADGDSITVVDNFKPIFEKYRKVRI